ncbi:MmgE/PrpD family protein [Streptomyces marispadix]|uniref:MmgE/PrpD family protein n=1 Tax=Streptomyces marispadix TaxID=2922868 RepID=A0ABS9T679_9ACTN|nr:MmgE/PrpD family protein [Streptomyces marispadix]MCH6163806.1 MmgE/PrpD family protein [Streptomyces marispadix]
MTTETGRVSGRATRKATRQLVERCHELASAPLPPEVVRRARHCVLDHLACALVGARLDHVRPNFLAMAPLAGQPEATTADGQMRSAFCAAYLNGESANALDYDDTLVGHPGAPVVAAALAAAERAGATLDDLVKGVVVGYEAHWLLGRAAQPSSSRAGKVRAVGLFDAVAASLAAAAVTDASARRLGRVLGLAGTQSCVPYVAKWYERPVPSVKNNLGWSAASAVLAVDLADSGAVGLPDLLDGPAGFWLMAGSDRWRWDGTLAETTEPAVMRAGFKRFPACWHVQQYLVALQSVLRRADEGRSVRHIRIDGPLDLQKFAEPRISGPADVAFSIRTLSALLAGGVEPGPAWVRPDLVASASAPAGQVSVSRTRHRAVTVTFDDARVQHRTVPRSDSARPHPFGLTESEVRAKFDRLVSPLLGADSARALRGSVIDSDGSLPLSRLTEAMRR